MTSADEPKSDGTPIMPLDSRQPSIARSYDAVLGGEDNYDIDRRVRDQLLEVTPELGTLAWDNRGFLVRATRFLAGGAAIGQFLDCGSGLPTVENTHQAARSVNPDAAVVYVDNDSTAIAHGRALLPDDERTTFVAADFTEPRRLLTHQAVLGHLDFHRPLALCHIGTLHHVPDEVGPHQLMAAYIDALPSGSYVALSHFYNPGADDEELAELAVRLETAFLDSPMGSGRFRARGEIAAFFDGLELVEPGLVTLLDWRPDRQPAAPVDPVRHLMIGAVGRKP